MLFTFYDMPVTTLAASMCLLVCRCGKGAVYMVCPDRKTTQKHDNTGPKMQNSTPGGEINTIQTV